MSKFDEVIERRNTLCNKWDDMEPLFGVPASDGLAMWVADMDFRPPQSVTRCMQDLVDQGIYGYVGKDRTAYHNAITWWMRERHGWDVDPDAIFATHGLMNGIGICLDTFTAPGDGIVLFTPVYHSFARVINAADRRVVECPLTLTDGRYGFDFEAYDAQMTGQEKMLILCSPHNPGGRVWTRAELQGVADFAKRHDLLIISDEIHHDLVYPGSKHIPMAMIDETISDRVIMMSSTTKTFNLAGMHSGNVIIHDPNLRARFDARLKALYITTEAFQIHMPTAAYSPDGAAWLEDLISYLDGNRRLLDEGLNALPGISSMPLEATYLSWVDFAGTGMSQSEISDRVLKQARIAPNQGSIFGTGGESFLRFNIATQRRNVEEAVSRLHDAFKDLQ
ncbi:MalY/PatB family protein [Primorskyibacter sp. S187A]|uniref:MalY/PatB family protein n=1 Tax=Primorskyibacter sp. S187A TaxID=3415130 RepID=UPI003C7AFA97